jgi:hypothetical protein
MSGNFIAKFLFLVQTIRKQKFLSLSIIDSNSALSRSQKNKTNEKNGIMNTSKLNRESVK